MAVTHRRFTFSEEDGISVDCYIFILRKPDGDREFWFKGKDLAKYLGYNKPSMAIKRHVPSEYQRTWKDINILANSPLLKNILSNWQPTTIFLSEPGVYALVARSKKPKAVEFTKWIYKDVLPSLRNTGYYSIKQHNEKLQRQLMESNQALIELENERQIAIRDAEETKEDSVLLTRRLADIAEDIVAKPKSDSLLHALLLHKYNDSGEIVFTRCQRRSLNNALKRLQARNSTAEELYRNIYVPNGINILNCVKEHLKWSKILYTAKFNVIRLIHLDDAEYLLSVVQKIVRGCR